MLFPNFNPVTVAIAVVTPKFSKRQKIKILPAHSCKGITDKTFQKHTSEIFDKADNRLHSKKAVWVDLMKDR
jgi:ornithine carbamoyltransferase